MKLDSNMWLLQYEIYEYRKSFLKRKNINGYKKNIKGTPNNLDKLLNCFDRKINKKEIFKSELKAKYLEGLNEIFGDYYHHNRHDKLTKKDAYNNYCAEQYIKGYNPICFDSFKKIGLTWFYK